MDKNAFQNIQKKLNFTNEETAKVLDVGIFLVQQWACGNWPVPRSIAIFLHTLQKVRSDERAAHKEMLNAYTKGYNEGRRFGHIEGYDEGHKEGLSEGYLAGQDTGRRAGYSEGYNTAMRN